MDGGLKWGAALALALLILALFALAVPDAYEGPVVLALNAQHAIRLLDAIGALLITGALIITWTVGLTWQRRNTHSIAIPPYRPQGRRGWRLE
jgi:hypothetical protein